MVKEIYFVILALSGLLALGMFFYSIFQIGTKKVYFPFALLVLGISLMSFLDAVYYGASPVYHYKIIVIEYIFINSLSVSWLVVSIILSGYLQEYMKRIVVVFSIVSLIGYLGVLTNPYHHLFYRYSIVFFETTDVYGPWFWYNTIVNYILIFSGIMLIVINSIRDISKENVILIVGVLIPLVVNFLYIFKIIKTDVDLTSLSLSVAAAVFLYVIIVKRRLEINILDPEFIIKDMGVGFIAVVDNRIIAQNDAVNKILNTDKKFTKISEVVELLHEQIPNRKKYIEEALVTKGMDLSEEIRLESENKIIRIDIKSKRMRGEERGKIITLTDLSEVQDMETLNVALRQMNAELKIQKEKQSRILGHLSHDLMTPITSIEGYLKYVLEEKLGTLSEKQRKALQIVDKNAFRLQKMLENVLLITKLETATDVYNKRLFDIKVLLIEVFEEKNLLAVEREFDFKIDIKLREKMIFGDREKIRIVMYNLLDNAFKYTDQFGEIIIFAENVNDKIVFGVKNSGRYISPKDIERITEPFVRLKSIGETKGTGLGLAIVKAIVKAHDGEFDVISARNGYNIFSVILPQY